MAFGNKDLSFTPATDQLLQSQADIYGNSFQNPMNPANQNAGWGINSSLLSPSYTAPFRPGYNGPQAGNNFGRMGFFQGVNQSFNPVVQDPNWGNPYMHDQQAVDAMTYRPADAAMRGFQRFAMPVAAMGLAGKMLGGYHGGWDFWKGSKGGYAAGRSFFGGMGSAMAGRVGLGAGASAAFGGVAGGLGGAAIGFAAPIAIASGLWTAGEKGIINPYINTRRTAQDFRENFNGITYGGSGMGHSVTGGGLGHWGSTVMGSEVTRQGIGDMTFSTGEYGAGASMIMRSGMMDNVSSGQMTRRVKESMEQVKLIMSVAAMPEMRDAVEQLAKLQQMGASTTGGQFSNAAGTMRQLGGMASMAGTTVQRLMNTVGAQGQYLYAANGMTPYLGQMAAAGTYSAMAAGNRMGLFSTAQMARMGGLDGATQASLTGQINVAQTLYNKIGNYNQYMGGGRGGSMVGNLNQFGQTMTNDPLGAYGGMMLYGRQMAGKQINERGSLAVEDQLMQIAQNLPGLMGKDGKISLERAVPLLMQMGMSEDQIHAWAAERMSETDGKSHANRLAGADRNLIEQQRQYMSQNKLYGGVLGSAYYSVNKMGRNLTKGAHNALVDPLTRALGTVGDSITSVKDSLIYGSSSKLNNTTIEEALGEKTADSSPLMYLSTSRSMSIHKSTADLDAESDGLRTADRINALADRGNKDAIAYLRATTKEEKKRAFDAILESGVLGKETTHSYQSDSSKYEQISGFLGGRKRSEGLMSKLGRGMDKVKDFLGIEKDKVMSFNDKLAAASGLEKADQLDSAQAIGLSVDIAARIQAGDITSTNIDKMMEKDASLQKLAKITGITNGGKLMAHATKAAGNAAKHGLAGFGTASLGVDRGRHGGGADAMKATAARNGNKVYDPTVENADSFEDAEKVGFAAIAQQNTQMISLMQQKFTESRVDFSGYKETTDRLDQAGKAFERAVDKFAQVMGGQPGTGGTSIFTRPGFGPDNQKTVNNSAGNR